MTILCNTSSVLMLIRIVPEMFRDKKYGCMTILDVRKEILRTKKFKTKHPWRTRYKAHLKAKSVDETDNNYKLYYNTILNSIDIGTVNLKTDKIFQLSPADIKIAAFALSNGYQVATEDKELNEFIGQEFNQTSLSALGVINIWLEEKVIEWNDDLQAIVADWEASREPAQPKKDIKEFERLLQGRFQYVGP